MLFFRLVVHVSKTRCAWNANVDNMFWFKIPGKAWQKGVHSLQVGYCIYMRYESKQEILSRIYKNHVDVKFSQKYTQQISLSQFLIFCANSKKLLPISELDPFPTHAQRPPTVSWAPRHRSTSQTSRISICTSDNHRTIAIIFNLSCATRMLWIALETRRFKLEKMDLFQDMGDGVLVPVICYISVTQPPKFSNMATWQHILYHFSLLKNGGCFPLPR